jgi:hypothetical protein
MLTSLAKDSQLRSSRDEKKKKSKTRKQKKKQSANFQNAVAANAKRRSTLCLCDQIEYGG